MDAHMSESRISGVGRDIARIGLNFRVDHLNGERAEDSLV